MRNGANGGLPLLPLAILAFAMITKSIIICKGAMLGIRSAEALYRVGGRFSDSMKQAR